MQTVQAIYTNEEIQAVADVDIQLINLAFSVNTKLGTAAIDNSIAAFTEFLTSQKGNFVGGMDLDYRRYIVSLMSGVDKEYQADAMSHIIFPRG